MAEDTDNRLHAQFLEQVTIWLQKPFDIHEIDAAIKNDEAVVERFRHEWTKVKSQFRDGDQLWSFTSPRSTWDSLAGRAG
jgi:hypothetical protein